MHHRFALHPTIVRARSTDMDSIKLRPRLLGVQFYIIAICNNRRLDQHNRTTLPVNW